MIEKLKGKIPDKIYSELPGVMSKFGINTPLRLAHFLAQCSHESMKFSRFDENLNYSAEALRRVFPKYFPTEQIANSFARQPEKIASRVYANRMGNGNESSKEGWKYRGRGAIQTTGKFNYMAFSKTVPEDILANPDLVATKYPLLSAAFFWNSKSLNRVADLGPASDIVKKVTKLVNGGFIGLAERIKEFNYFYNILK